MFTKTSLEKLREKIDLIEVLSSHIQMKRAGSAMKALCPFHQEKTPSFMVQKGDSYYHCFGCGAHGDAIQFLMNFLNLSFVESVEALAEKFHVHIERQDTHAQPGINKIAIKEVCSIASQCFHAFLLYTEEGKPPLHYLYKRGITIDFIKKFEVGFAPADPNLFLKVMRGEKIEDASLIEAGLLTEEGKKPFFRDRITFPIRAATGGTIGFSARKYKEETFGGKYINTPETSIFKKSRLLYGLNYSRRRIVKERRVILVEGQIDCLKMIEAGLNVTVASLGTAFGEGHVEELLKLQVRTAYLLFDSDAAGIAAASKTGDLLQKKGIDVYVIQLPKGNDPDSYLTQFGVEKIIDELEAAQNYLDFQVHYLSETINLQVPAGKAELVKLMKKQIEQWEDPVLVHESLRKIAAILRVPEEMLGIKHNLPANVFVKKQGTLTQNFLDTHRVLEIDLLRWLILAGDQFINTARFYLTDKHFLVDSCRILYEKILEEGKTDLLTLAQVINEQTLIDEIMQKKVNLEKAETHFLATVQKLLDREWMQKREAIRLEIQSGHHTEEKVLELAKEFDALKSKRTIIELVK